MSDDIVVEGFRHRTDMRTKAVLLSADATISNRQQYAISERLAKCAARSRLSKVSRLQAVVDGDFNSPTHRLAQDRLVRTYITCGESTSLLSLTSPPQPLQFMSMSAAVVGDFTGAPPGISEGAPLGQSVYDRGAFIIQAIKQFAPDLTLTREQTGDPAVHARFNRREMPRNRFRLPADYKYFEIAVCMVRVEPRLSVALVKSSGSSRLKDVQAALIDRARICVGDARAVKADPTEFRIYIADAVYRWAVAAKGVESLIPADPL